MLQSTPFHIATLALCLLSAGVAAQAQSTYCDNTYGCDGSQTDQSGQNDAGGRPGVDFSAWDDAAQNAADSQEIIYNSDGTVSVVVRNVSPGNH